MFWRREGGPLDIKDNSPMAWLLRITDADGTEERTFGDGASWWSDGVEWHEVVNVGDEESIYLVFEPKAGASAGKRGAQ